MTLRQQLEGAIDLEASYFRAQLLREDVARLKQLEELAAQHGDAAAFRKAGLMIGWTPGDTRSFELKPALEPFLDAFFECAKAAGNEAAEAKLRGAWDDFDRFRMDLLVGCLARVPKPIDSGE